MKLQNVATAGWALLLGIAAFAAPNDGSAVDELKGEEWTVPGIGMQMRRIPAGTLIMGSPEDEIARRPDETQHEVTISKPFYMAAYECRQGEYYQVMMPEYDHSAWTWWRGPIHDGAAFTYRFPRPAQNQINPVGLTFPMEMITWDRAMAFCRKLTEIEREAGRLPEGYIYRLPTEAEWEYASRAGSAGPYSFEGDFTSAEVLRRYTYAGSGDYYTFGVGDTVSNRKPNAWGLYDMHGNVWEWCLDWYGTYEEGSQVDPVGPPQGSERVVRGGSCAPWFSEDPNWLQIAVHPFLRSAARYSFRPHTDMMITLGFRVVLAQDLPETDEINPSK